MIPRAAGFPSESISQIQLERRGGGAAVERDVLQLVALGDVVEERVQEIEERARLDDRLLDAARIQKIGVFEGVHGGHEGVDARVVARAKERIAEGLEVGEKFANEREARGGAPSVFAGRRV